MAPHPNHDTRISRSEEGKVRRGYRIYEVPNHRAGGDEESLNESALFAYSLITLATVCEYQIAMPRTVYLSTRAI